MINFFKKNEKIMKKFTDSKFGNNEIDSKKI
jgi:hypothetical protein